jgi:uncharacterized surface anchored protein
MALAACDSDRPLEPTRAQVPTAAQPAVYPIRQPLLTTGYTDFDSKYVAGGSFTVKDSVDAPIMVVADNSQLDLDKTPGKVKIMLPKAGAYAVCETQAPAGYDFATVPTCIPVVAQSSTVSQVGPFPVGPVPGAWWMVSNGAVEDGAYVLVPGAAFKVSIPRQFFFINVVDNGQNDLDPWPGKIYVKLPKAAVYTVCETQPPAGYWNANPACRTLDVSASTITMGGVFFNYEKQVISQ